MDIGLSDAHSEANFDSFCRHILPRSCHIGILFCGSFYEQPLEYAMLNLTDLDQMFFDRNVIAAAETAVISKSFHGEILTLETKDCHLGFARLLRRREEKTEYFEWNRKSLHGPAIKSRLMTQSEVSYIFGAWRKSKANLMAFKELTTDHVRSFLCPHWPSEADEWRTRKRYRDWPTRDMIEKIVAGGCHLVPKSHESNFNDDTVWRFSFSRAELILLNSWNEIQTYIFHILRLLKSDVVAQCGGEKKTFLCTYYFKTLMLWACEERPSEFWNEDRIEAAIEELLLQLIEWIIDRNCPNYFIRGNNMLDYLQSGDDVSNEVLLLHDARKVVPTVVTSQPKVYRGKMFHIQISDKALLIAQLAINRRFFSNALNHKHGRYVVENLSSSPLLSHEVENLFTAVQLHCFLMSDLSSCEEKRSERRKAYESDALSYFQVSCKRKGAKSYSDVYISLFDSPPIVVNRFLYETPGVHQQRMCCYRRSDEGNLTKEAMEALCQTMISTADNNQHNPSFFISAAYHANFQYTGRRDYRQALKICDEGLASFGRLEAIVDLNTFESVFSDEILCVFINRQYINIFDEGIQVIFGFLVLHINYIKRIEDRELHQELHVHDFVLQVCPVGFLEYIRIRCRSKLHLSKGDCFEALNFLYDKDSERDTTLRKQSNATFFAALCIKL